MSSGALAGRHVLITGAGRGIGLGIARAASREGALVWGVGRGPADDPAPFESYDLLDVTDDEQVARYFAEREDAPLAGLVNNAGRARPSPFLETSADDLDDAIALNLRAPFVVSQHAARSMVRRGGGSIVHIGSVNARRGVAGTAGYSATKGALSALTRMMATELAASGIRVNEVVPAATDTERLRSILTEEALAARVSRIPLGRLASPDDIAETVVFLLSDRSAFTTGQSLAVDGGYLAFGTR